MKVQAAALLASAGLAAAFVQPTAFAGTQLAKVASSSSVQMAGEMSKALPFVAKPAKLTGSMPGDFGFDPLGMSDNLNLEWMQAAELKHCRVAMLAVVGVFVIQVFHLPADQFDTSNPLEALSKVPLAGHLQIFALIGGLEMESINKAYAGGDAWDVLTQDPIGSKQFAAKSAADKAKAQLQEIKNGRLAMFAIIGLLVQTALFGHALP